MLLEAFPLLRNKGGHSAKACPDSAPTAHAARTDVSTIRRSELLFNGKLLPKSANLTADGSKVQTFFDSAEPCRFSPTPQSPFLLESPSTRSPQSRGRREPYKSATSKCGGDLMHAFAATFLVTPTITGNEATMLILRWFHFIAGIAWVGL